MAVARDGSYFFVADGYCNKRVIKYKLDTKDGVEVATKVFEITEVDLVPKGFKIPHSLALILEDSEICVADREHGRVLCFDSGDGSFTRIIRPPQVGSSVFGISYSPTGKLGGQLQPLGQNIHFKRRNVR